MNVINHSTENLCEEDTHSECSFVWSRTTEQNDGFSITLQNEKDTWRLSCTTQHGGRITSFQLNNREILVQKNNSGMFGSTFWTAPENWGWPPPHTIDEGYYAGSIADDQSVTLTGEIDSNLQVRVVKHFSPDTVRCGIHVNYTIINESPASRWFAPWEISRVEKGGLTFYHPGNKQFSGITRGDIQTVSAFGACWYQHPKKMTDDAKLFDSSRDGWIAHTDGTLLYVKTFEEAFPVAPGEGEIEIYACNDYVEVEEQGSHVQIPPGQSSTWRVSWYLRELPASLRCICPSEELIRQVQSILK